jgi:hypothetical protein
MQTERPAGRSYQAPGPRARARQDRARAEAVERLGRWKRGIAAAAVVAFGTLIGLIGIAGARGASNPSRDATSGSPTVTSQADGSVGDRADSPDAESGDGFFDHHDDGYGLSNGGSQSAPLGQSGVS